MRTTNASVISRPKQNKEFEAIIAEKRKQRPRRDGLFSKLVCREKSATATFEEKRLVADRLVEFFAKHRAYVLRKEEENAGKDQREGEELIEILKTEEFDM